MATLVVILKQQDANKKIKKKANFGDWLSCPERNLPCWPPLDTC
jgi:hypothetical protein